MEGVTSDIPNNSEKPLKTNDENGIVRIGARVFSREISWLVKSSEKGESDPSPEKLLRAIFGGNKAGDGERRCFCTKASPSLKGVVIDKETLLV